MIKYFVLMFCFTFFSCGDNNDSSKSQNEKKDKKDKKEVNSKKSTGNERTLTDFKNHRKFSLKDYYSKNDTLDEIVEKIFDGLKDDEKISQMIITSVGNYGKPVEQVMSLIKSKKVGGVVFLGGSKEKFKNLIIDFTKVNEGVNSLPLIYSTDAEPSLINMKISGLDNFPPTNTINKPEESKKNAKEISEILKSIGFNQNFAPVCDNNINKEIIGNRSFGNDPDKIEKLTSSFIEETQTNNIIATAKHFPGHGNVKGDSHKSLVYIDGELKELDIYKKLLMNKNQLAVPISIMIGHIAIKNNKEDYNTNDYPASLSPKIVTELLKKKMHFTGIVITDGMNMGALNSLRHPSFLAVEAGCDMVLMPSDEEQLFKSILSEFKANPKFQSQINDSVKKIIRAKVCLGMN